jgi:hypothetical protein
MRPEALLELFERRAGHVAHGDLSGWAAGFPAGRNTVHPRESR